MVLKALPPAGRSGGEVLPGELGGPVTRRSVVGGMPSWHSGLRFAAA